MAIGNVGLVVAGIMYCGFEGRFCWFLTVPGVVGKDINLRLLVVTSDSQGLTREGCVLGSKMVPQSAWPYFVQRGLVLY